jgi:hypothetical protein
MGRPRKNNKAIAAWEQQCIRDYGFYVHYMVEDPNQPYQIDAHTHGLMETFDHSDLQIVLPLPQETTIKLFQVAVDMLKTGTRFQPYKKYPNVIEDSDVVFIPVSDGKVSYLRMIIADEAGVLEKDKMDPTFALQYQNEVELN